ncbi:FliM/FliN family flagellar motor switch protein [Amaricoccus sp.]|uniref:FliM/FliN family flagellar motor switch protein n=1 Tax=Amaricoccus sp. TaxID=1872485 RepID=UPI002C94DE59|nr:FliM/FliN family flagellar motor switch protein [Amaricoccus sp.]HRW13619.1 FliM/FliN family flagellar motor switch protein [Amaricoccus sp.]
MSLDTSVLSKKLRQGGVSRSPLAETDLIVESFARGTEDRLRPLIKTMINVTVGAVAVTKLAQAIGGITSPAVLGIVDVEDADTPALIACDADLAYHLVDLMLGGDPALSPEPAARAFSSIDMALCRLHLDAILQAFVHAVGVGLGRPLTKTLRIRDQRQSTSQLRLAPDYIDVLTFAASVSLGEAGRTGTISLVLPLSALDVIRASIQARNLQAARERPNDLWKALMRRAAATAPVRVDAVLHRQKMSLAALQNLHIGQVLEIPRQAVEEIRLTIPQPAGRTAVLATGHLGGYQDNKVVRLAAPPDARVVAHIARALRAGAVAAGSRAEPVEMEPEAAETDAEDDPAAQPDERSQPAAS